MSKILLGIGSGTFAATCKRGLKALSLCTHGLQQNALNNKKLWSKPVSLAFHIENDTIVTEYIRFVWIGLISQSCF